MDDVKTLSETERLLLIAAAVQNLGPDTDLSFANTAKVVNQALRWLGLSDEQIRQGWEEAEDRSILEEMETADGSADRAENQTGMPEAGCLTSNEEVYNVLILMIHRLYGSGSGEQKGQVREALFEYTGNWGNPNKLDSPAAWPFFNSCRLTKHGERIALKLLDQHPEYGEDVDH